MKKVLLVTLMGASVFTFAQKKKSSPEESTPQSQTTTSAIDGKVAGMKKFAGFFDYYYDEKQDKTFLVIDKFDSEFLYVESLTAAVGSNDIGLDRNQLGRERVVKFEAFPWHLGRRLKPILRDGGAVGRLDGAALGRRLAGWAVVSIHEVLGESFHLICINIKGENQPIPHF